MSKEPTKNTEPKKTKADLVQEAWEKAENKDSLAVKARKGDVFYLLDAYTIDNHVYLVTAIMGGGDVILSRMT